MTAQVRDGLVYGAILFVSMLVWSGANAQMVVAPNCPSTQQANASIAQTNGSVTQITGLTIGAWQYCIAFTGSTTFAAAYPNGLQTLPDANAQTIIDAIAAVLNAAGVYYAGTDEKEEFGIPVSVSGNSFSYVRGFQVNNNSGGHLPSDWIYDDKHGSPLGPYGVTQYGLTSFVILTPIPISQTIAFCCASTRYLGTEPFIPQEIRASSNLPVTLTSLSPATCSVASGTTVTLISTGTCTLQATQAGNSYYLPASIEGSFTIAPTPALTFTANQLSPFAPQVGCTVTGFGTQTLGLNNAAQVIGFSSGGGGVPTTGTAAGVTCVWGQALLWNGTNPTNVELSPHWYDGYPLQTSPVIATVPALLAINDAGYMVGSADGGVYTGPARAYSSYPNLLCSYLGGSFATYWPKQAVAGGVLASGLPFVPFTQLSFPLSDRVTSIATAVSSDGWVAGSAPYNGSSNDAPNAAALWDGGNNPINLGPGGACGINNAHTVVGYAPSSSGGGATVWAGPSYTPIALAQLGVISISGTTLPLASSAAAISNDGWVVGSAETNYSNQTGNSDTHAVLWVNNGGSYSLPVDLLPLSGTLQGSVLSAALAVNSNHKIVGYTANFPGPTVPVYPSVFLPALVNNITSIPLASGGHATLWDAGQPSPSGSIAPFDLNTLIVSGLPSTHVLTNASGINDSGWISADAVDFATGSSYPYVLVPIVPASPTASTVIRGQTSTITAGAPSGPGPFRYQWFQGTAGDTSAPIAGATQPTITTQPLGATTRYWAQITSANGIVEDTATTTITVTAPPSAALTVSLASVSVDSSGNYIANLVFTNMGTGSAPAAQLMSASLVVSNSGRAVTTPTTTQVPAALSTIAPGTSFTAGLVFPSSAGIPGAAAALRWSVSYSSGSASGTVRLALP